MAQYRTIQNYYSKERLMELVNEERKSIKQQAKDELIEDKTKEFRKQLKAKLKEEQDAKIILANIRREIDFLEKKIEQEIADING